MIRSKVYLQLTHMLQELQLEQAKMRTQLRGLEAVCALPQRYVSKEE